MLMMDTVKEVRDSYPWVSGIYEVLGNIIGGRDLRLQIELKLLNIWMLDEEAILDYLDGHCIITKVITSEIGRKKDHHQGDTA